MAKLQRKSAKLFAEDATAAAGGISQFGSLAAGTPNYSTDPDVIQALDAYKEGWSSAVLGTKSPALEDRNALDYLLSYQQAYIMQRGIPEYLDTETYYIGSVVSNSSQIYISLTDNNTGNPLTDTNNWRKFYTPLEIDALLALKVAKAGDTMSGNLVMDGATVYNKVSGTNYRMLDTRDIHVIDAYYSGTAWYRVYTDGFCIQGASGTYPAGTTQLTLLKTFSNVKGAIISLNSAQYAGQGAEINEHIGIVDNSTININSGSALPEYMSWVIYGYISL